MKALLLLCSLGSAGLAHAANCSGEGRMTVTLAPCPVSVLMKHQSTGVGLSTFAKLGGGIPDPFYIAASAPSGIFTPGGFSVGNAGFDKVSITFTVIPTLTVGDHTGSVDLKFCGDSHCTNVLTEVQLPYTIHVVVPPHLSQLSPVSLLLAAKPFTLKLMGSGFRSGSKLRFGGLLLNTNFVSPVELTAQVDLSKVLK